MFSALFAMAVGCVLNTAATGVMGIVFLIVGLGMLLALGNTAL
ncbi:hypothetical protein [Sphingomonas sp. 1P08PE]